MVRSFVIGSFTGIGILAIITLSTYVCSKRNKAHRNFETETSDDGKEDDKFFNCGNKKQRTGTSIGSSSGSVATFYSAGSDDLEEEEEEEEEFLNCFDEEPEALRLFEKVDDLMQDDESKLQAFNVLQENEWKFSGYPNFLWRFAKAHQLQAHALQKGETQKKYIYEGLDYVKKALELDEENPEAHKWYAILIGMQTEYLALKEKAKNGTLFVEHLKIALRKRPKDYSLHHLLGMFKLRIAQLSWGERIAASAFFDIPDVHYSDAISDFLEAERLGPRPWKENRLALAKCYLGNDDKPSASKWLSKAKEIKPKTKQDEAYDKEIEELQRKYSLR